MSAKGHQRSGGKMSYCVKCGAQLIEGDQFCYGCGTRVETQASSGGNDALQQLLLEMHQGDLCGVDELRAGAFPALDPRIDRAASLVRRLVGEGKYGETEAVFSHFRSKRVEAKARLFTAAAPTRQSYEEAARQVEREMLAEAAETGRRWRAVLDEIGSRAGLTVPLGSHERIQEFGRKLVEGRAAVGLMQTTSSGGDLQTVKTATSEIAGPIPGAVRAGYADLARSMLENVARRPPGTPVGDEAWACIVNVLLETLCGKVQLGEYLWADSNRFCWWCGSWVDLAAASCACCGKQLTDSGGEAASELRFDGLYQTPLRVDPGGIGVRRYARFYPSGRVFTEYSNGNAYSAFVRLVEANADADKRGFFQLSDGRIAFCIASPNGTVDYQGAVEREALALDSYSNINGNRETLRLSFVPFVGS
jgi:hypothetical protein